MSELLLDAAGRRRSPATMPGFHAGRPPRNKGHHYPADPPAVEEIVAVMRTAGDGRHGCRLRGLIVVLWRAGLRIHEALALNESDLDHRRGSLLVRRGKGGRRREVGLDEWAWEHLQPRIDLRLGLRSARSSASSTGRPADDHGRAPPRAPTWRRTPRLPAFAGAARPISSGHAHWHHLDLPAGHRQRRDHRGRPRPARADGPRERLASSLTLAATPLIAHCDRRGNDAVAARSRRGHDVCARSRRG
jgi:Phage integrase family